jgi:Fe-Mn family superoxide dismutase
MEYSLPPLPFEKSALSPLISQETIEFHYGKHHNTYVTTLNKLIKGTEFENMSLEQICAKASGPIFNNAGQHWNHSFYWQCLTPQAQSDQPSGELAKAINRDFETLDHLKEKFISSAAANFGSGWTWLVEYKDRLSVVNTSNANLPLVEGKKPLLTCDVWEHAYYIDYRNNRAAYLESFWKVINWKFVEKQFLS